MAVLVNKRWIGDQAPQWPLRVNRLSPQSDRLHFWLPALDALPTPRDLSLHAHAVTAIGAPTVTFQTGRHAHNFGGVFDELYYRAGVTWPSQAATVTLWVYVTGGNDALAFNLNYANSGETNRTLAYIPFTDDTLYWDWGNVTGGRVSTSFAAYYNKWTHVGLVGRAGSHAIYLDGVLVASNTNADVPSSFGTDGWEVGAGHVDFGTRYYHGKIADFRAYTDDVSYLIPKIYRNGQDLYAPRRTFVFLPAAVGVLISSIDTDDIVNDEQANVLIAGSGFGA